MALTPTRAENWLFSWIEHPTLDILVAVLVGIATTAIAAWRDWGQVVASADAATRRAVFQVIATLCGTLLGLTLASLSILVGLIRLPVAQVEQVLSGRRRVRMAKAFVSAIVGLGISLALALWAILNNTRDGTAGSDLVQTIVIAIVVLSGLRISRVIWILWKLLQITASGTAGQQLSADDEDRF